MIKVSVNKEANEVYLQIVNSLYFNEIKEVFNQYKVSFDKEFKINYCKCKTFLDMKKALSDIDRLVISIPDNQFINDCIIRPAEIKIYRKSLHPNSWKFKPLDDYQIEGIKFLVTHEAGILNLPCGSGKTYVYSNALEELFASNEVEKLLIISTRSSLYNWKRELLKFSHIVETDIEIVLNETNRKVFDVYSDKKVIITDYDTFKMISEHYTALEKTSKKKMATLTKKKQATIRDTTKVRATRIDFSAWNPNNKACILLDEIHKIKNNSARSAHIIAASPKFSRRYGGSGTLLPRDFTDSFNPAKFLHPSIYFNYGKTDWEKDFCLYNNRNNKYLVTGYDETKLEIYKNRFNRYIFTRTEEECFKGKLPDYVPKKIYIPMNPVMQDLYDSIIELKFREIEEKIGYLKAQKCMNVFPYLMLMLSDINLIQNSFIIEENKQVFDTWKIEHNPKFDITNSIIEDHLEEDTTCKIAIGSYHPKVLDMLSTKCKYKHTVLHGENTKGSNKDRIRDEAIEDFKHDKDSRILLLQPQIFSEAINITEVNVQINWDFSWEFDKNFQFSRRFFRTGQTKKTYRYDLIYDKSFEIIQQKVLDDRFLLNNITNNFEMLTMEEWKGIKNGDDNLIDLFIERIKEKNKV